RCFFSGRFTSHSFFTEEKRGWRVAGIRSPLIQSSYEIHHSLPTSLSLARRPIDCANSGLPLRLITTQPSTLSFLDKAYRRIPAACSYCMAFQIEPRRASERG